MVSLVKCYIRRNMHSFWISNGNVSLIVRENTPVLFVTHVRDLEKHFDIKGVVGDAEDFLAIWMCSSVVFIVFHVSYFVFCWDTVNIQKDHLKDVLKKSTAEIHQPTCKLKKTLTESIKAILWEIHFTKFVL